MYTAKIKRDTAGVPTGLENVVSASVVEGMVAKVAQIASPDAVVIPGTLVEKVLIEGMLPAASAAVQKKMLTGAWGIPFTKPAQ